MLRILIFLYQWIIFVPLLCITMVITATATGLGSFLFSSKFWGYHPARIWSIITCYTAFCPAEVIGSENIKKEESYIFVANHQGSFDIFLIYGFLNHNFRWIMKQELRKVPFAGKACELAGQIFIDRTSVSSIKASMDFARRQLVGGLSLMVFPEGSRTSTGKIGKFKKGAFQLAVDLNLPVVPLTIEGPFDIMPIGTNTLRPHKMRLTIHPPITTNKEGVEAIIDLSARSREAIASALSK
ncbi:MAG: lysophospholipid acyltransferase family protein [Bacteroidales bacterium]